MPDEIPPSLWGVDSQLDVYLEKVKRNHYSSIFRGLVINESDFFPGDSAYIRGKVRHDTLFLVR